MHVLALFIYRNPMVLNKFSTYRPAAGTELVASHCSAGPCSASRELPAVGFCPPTQGAVGTWGSWGWNK